MTTHRKLPDREFGLIDNPRIQSVAAECQSEELTRLGRVAIDAVKGLGRHIKRAAWVFEYNAPVQH